MIPEVPPGQRWQLNSETLNALIRAANALAALKVVDETDGSGARRSAFQFAPGGAVLRIVHPPGASPGAAPFAWRNLTAALSVAGVVPTTTEINAALVAAYTDPSPDLVPADSDRIVLTLSGAPKFLAYVSTASLSASGVFVRSFVVDDITYYAALHQLGLY